jgi:hypothetical protein
MTSSLVNACKKKNALYKTFLTHKSTDAERRYKTYKNKLTAILRLCEKNYYSDMLENNKKDMKKTWNIINELIHKRKKKSSNLPAQFLRNNAIIKGNLNIANGFNDYFINVGPNLADKITNDNPSIKFSHYMDDNINDSIFLDPVTELEILNVVDSCKRKTSKDYDDISMASVKDVMSNVIKPLLYIFNLSFASGIFPDKMKITKVIPIFKAGDKQTFSNYRPVSLLPQFSKLLEKLFNRRLMHFIKANKVLYPGQYGFQNNLSTSNAIMELTEEITTAFDESKYTLGVFIDLKKAFDTIDHNILLQKLERYGIRGVANKWIYSYLQDRLQYVTVNNINSSKQTVRCGVPQGSVLGPSLFILYVNDMCKASNILKAILFADDTNLFLSGYNIKNLCDLVTNELSNLNQWFTVNKLSLNVNKTNFMVFSKKNTAEDYTVSINNTNIERVYVTKFLGVNIDAQLNWADHINMVKSKIAKNLSIMYKLKYTLNNGALYSLYCTLILPFLNYCNETWGNNYYVKLQPLVTIQKKAMRIIEKTEYRAHTTPIFLKYKTLKLVDLIKFNSLCFMFKVHINAVPNSLAKYFCRINKLHDHGTRHCNDLQIQFCRSKQKSFAMSIVGPKMWLQLRQFLKSLPNVYTFKKHYKNSLIEEYVEWYYIV